MSQGDYFLAELDRLAAEVDLVYRTLVLPGWLGPQHGLPDTLYGYIMGLFARVDLYSAHWYGSNRDQSNRMVAFLCTFARPERYPNSLAVELWRHKLMHTSAPRALMVTSTGKTHYWLLHWGDEHLPRSQHFTFQDGDRILNMSLAGLIDDVRLSANGYLGQLKREADLRLKFDTFARTLSPSKVRRI